MNGSVIIDYEGIKEEEEGEEEEVEDANTKRSNNAELE